MMSHTYHVSISGNDHHSGAADAPFRTIQQAARIALPGDDICVHEGVYREHVRPECGGSSDACRITYEAAQGEKVVIKGSERVTGWTKVTDNVWRLQVDSSLFTEGNPFATPLEGDWLVHPCDGSLHLGDVYLNGVSLYEAFSAEEVLHPAPRKGGFRPEWSIIPAGDPDPVNSMRRFFVESTSGATTLLANFQGQNPNAELVEISVRSSCFFPDKIGLNYITVRGFEMCHAATPWAPPTADQGGMVGPHWSRGWVIEQNYLHDTKCCALSLGKEASTGENLHTRMLRKSGTYNQAETIFRALQAGWCKEKIGSHRVLDNVIEHCGQCAIVGNLGGAFSRIEHNLISHIGDKQEFFGHEQAGIKLHAAIDAVLENNQIHHCVLGTWMDWEAQGVHIARNVYHHNERDLMIEVSHGPCLVYDNVFASGYNFDNAAQGTALVHNLMAGGTAHYKALDRMTPYHFPHSTQVSGYSVTYCGDDRVLNNLFVGAPTSTERLDAGTVFYNEFTHSWEEYEAALRAFGSGHDEDIYLQTPQPAYIRHNAYLDGAKPCDAEKERVLMPGADACISVTMDGDDAVLHITLPQEVVSFAGEVVNTATLDSPRVAEAPYDQPDGSCVTFATDLIGERRSPDHVMVGPLCGLHAGANQVKIWSRTRIV